MNNYLLFDGRTVWMISLKQSTENHRACLAAIAILHYLRDHPSAKDSASGIAKWWVSEEREVVERALALLVKEGMIEKRKHLYQLAPSKSSMGSNFDIEKTLRRLRRRK